MDATGKSADWDIFSHARQPKALLRSAMAPGHFIHQTYKQVGIISPYNIFRTERGPGVKDKSGAKGASQFDSGPRCRWPPAAYSTQIIEQDCLVGECAE
jgi:hypothetical protein